MAKKAISYQIVSKMATRWRGFWKHLASAELIIWARLALIIKIMYIVNTELTAADRSEFEKLRGEYYQARQRDVASGHQTKNKLEELGPYDAAKDPERRVAL